MDEHHDNGQPLRVTIINTPYEEGVPLKTWEATNEHHATVAALALQAADAEEAAVLLFDGEPVGTSEWAALGRANYHAFLHGFEPLFALMGERPISDPDAEQSLRRFAAPYITLAPATTLDAEVQGP